jgi:hypothetical protein
MTKHTQRRPRQRKAKPQRVHDLRPLYGPIPGQPQMAALTIEEPGGLLSTDQATREIGQRRDGLLAHPRGEHEWVPPMRPTIIVAQTIRGDPLGKMFARHQINPVRYAAGRSYQELHTVSQVGRIAATDPSRPYVQGGRFAELITDRQRRAARRLRMIDAAILKYLGSLGLFVVRTVLIDCKPLAAAADRTKTDKWTRGFLFSASLTMIAIKLGMATVGLEREDTEAKAEADRARANHERQQAQRVVGPSSKVRSS